MAAVPGLSERGCANADGELMLVLQQGTLARFTEFGRLQAAPARASAQRVDGDADVRPFPGPVRRVDRLAPVQSEGQTRAVGEAKLRLPYPTPQMLPRRRDFK